MELSIVRGPKPVLTTDLDALNHPSPQGDVVCAGSPAHQPCAIVVAEFLAAVHKLLPED